MKTQTTDTIITAGKKYVDIDAYASMIAYRELLKSLGQTNTYAISTAKLNSSIPMFLRDSTYKLDASINTRNTTSVVIVDTSNPDFIDESVSRNSIVEVIDHHTGFENY